MKNVLSIVVAIILLYFCYYYITKKEETKELVKKEQSIDIDSTIVHYKNRIDSLEGQLKVKPKIVTAIKKDTLQYNIDSLWEEAKLFWLNKLEDSLNEVTEDTLNKYDYLSSIDTTLIDTSDNIETNVEVTTTSPIPLHPETYHTIGIESSLIQYDTVKTLEKVYEIEEPLYENNWFWAAIGEFIIIAAVLYKSIGN